MIGLLDCGDIIIVKLLLTAILIVLFRELISDSIWQTQNTNK